jgi:hypothetical protein
MHCSINLGLSRLGRSGPFLLGNIGPRLGLASTPVEPAESNGGANSLGKLRGR